MCRSGAAYSITRLVHMQSDRGRRGPRSVAASPGMAGIGYSLRPGHWARGAVSGPLDVSACAVELLPMARGGRLTRSRHRQCPCLAPQEPLTLQPMDPTQLRIILLVLGLIFIGAVYWFGRPQKPGQGRRLSERVSERGGNEVRAEPAFGSDAHDSLDKVIQAELARLERTLAGEEDETSSESGAARQTPRSAPRFAEGAVSQGHAAEAADEDQEDDAPHEGSRVGARPTPEFDKVVSLIVAARAGTLLHGGDILVAAEKAGLVFGDMQIFHRMPEGRPEAGPIFSVANVVKPGNFDLRQPDRTQTPGVTFFMTLPGPLPALDAWETMLPAAQRFAELLDAVVLDDERNALGRQRVQFLRDELRAYDRERERQSKRPW